MFDPHGEQLFAVGGSGLVLAAVVVVTAARVAGDDLQARPEGSIDLTEDLFCY